MRSTLVVHRQRCVNIPGPEGIKVFEVLFARRQDLELSFTVSQETVVRSSKADAQLPEESRVTRAARVQSDMSTGRGRIDHGCRVVYEGTGDAMLFTQYGCDT